MRRRMVLLAAAGAGLVIAWVLWPRPHGPDKLLKLPIRFLSVIAFNGPPPE